MYCAAEIVEIMLEKHHDLLDRSDSGGNNALHYAAQKDNKRVVKRLLRERTGLAYKRNDQNQTPLHVAAHHGSTNAIRALLQQCPDVAEMSDAAGRNAFHAAVASGKTDALRCLLRNVRPAELLNHVDDDGNVTRLQVPVPPSPPGNKSSAVTAEDLFPLTDVRVPLAWDPLMLRSRFLFSTNGERTSCLHCVLAMCMYSTHPLARRQIFFTPRYKKISAGILLVTNYMVD